MIGVTIAAVVGLAAFSIVAAVLTTIVTRHPERAAAIVVVGLAVGAVGFVGLGLLMLGVGSIDAALKRASAVEAAPWTSTRCGPSSA